MTLQNPTPPQTGHHHHGKADGRSGFTRAASRALAVVFVGLCAACAGAPAPETFALSSASLTATVSARPITPLSRQLLVGEPTAIQPLDGDQLIVVSNGRVSTLGGGQWSDRLPRLIQSRIVQGFEQQGRAVGRVGSGLAGDRVLGTDLRAFQIVNGGAPDAQVELSARLSDGQTGQIIVARVFKSTFPAEGTTPRQAAAALERALDDVVLQITRWSITNAARPAPQQRLDTTPTATN